jgi:hypothetical protein
LKIYLVVLVLGGFIDGVALSFVRKPDSVALSFLAFADGVTGILYYMLRKSSSAYYVESNVDSSINNTSKASWRSCGYYSLRVINRILMVFHGVLILLSMAGSIELALTFRYENP